MITLVVGGARSGKSAVAERLVARLSQPVTYIATYVATDTEPDTDMGLRIASHQARRPASWRTLEAGGQLCSTLADVEGTALIDALGTWVAVFPNFEADIAGLCAALKDRAGDTVIVSEEVGLGVHPSTVAGRRFRDALGDVNQAVAAIADDVLLVVAGRILRLEELTPLP